MKSIKQQYIDLKEGRMSQQNFMRNLRMTMPQYVTNITSYGDAVKILKNKGILNETLIKQLDKAGLEEDYDDYMDYRDEEEAEAKEDERIDNMINQKLEDEYEEKMRQSLAAADAAIEKAEEEESGKYTTGMDQFPIREAKYKWENTSGKSMYAQFKEIDNLNGQEVLIGIDYEIEHNHELSKTEAIKLVIKNLKKNPIYYTATLMAGKEMLEIPTIGKLKPGSDKMRELKGEDSLVDKDNGMKPVKDVEKVKASANKAKKETNKPEGTISLMSLVAKASRGVDKMTATGEKMKVVKEAMDFDSVTSYGDFKMGDKVMVDPEVATEAGLKAGKIYNITGFRIYKRGSILQNADALLDNGEEINTDYITKAPKLFTSSTNLGSSLSKLSKDDLMEMIRKELAEALGAFGGDNVTDVAGHQLDEVSGFLSKIKDKIANSSLFKKLIDTIVSKMSDKDIATFKAKFNLSEAEGGPSLEDIMSKVDAANPDKNAKTPEDLKEALDEDTLGGKIASLVRGVAGINLLALGGAPLGIFINSLLGLSTWGFGAFIGPVISLVASLIIHSISSRLLGKTDDDSMI